MEEKSQSQSRLRYCIVKNVNFASRRLSLSPWNVKPDRNIFLCQKPFILGGGHAAQHVGS